MKNQNRKGLLNLLQYLLNIKFLHIPHHSLPPPPGVIAIAAGDYHTCVVLTGGGVDCWGSNSNGQLGTGGTSDTWTPTGVTGLETGGENSQYTCVLIRLYYFLGVKSLYTARTVTTFVEGEQSLCPCCSARASLSTKPLWSSGARRARSPTCVGTAYKLCLGSPINTV